MGELTNELTTAQLAIDDMVRLANDLDFAMSLEVANAILVRKTIVAEHVLATVEKALEAAGGAGFYRKAGLERLLRDAHGAQFHPLRGSASTVLPAALLSVSIRSRTQPNDACRVTRGQGAADEQQ